MYICRILLIQLLGCHIEINACLILSCLCVFMIGVTWCICTVLSTVLYWLSTVLVGTCCQAYVRRCVTVTGSTRQAAVSVMLAGRVKNATCHRHTVRTRRAVAMAGVLTARVCVLLDSEETTVSMVSTWSLSTALHLLRAVFVRFSLGGGQSFDWRLATIAGMEVAKMVPWNSLLN